MPVPQSPCQLLKQIRNRLSLLRFAVRLRALLLKSGVAVVTLLLLSWLLAVPTGGWGFWMVTAAVAISLVVCALTVSRPTLTETARFLDRVARTQDLFLTTLQLETAAGQFQALVIARAEQTAANIRAADIAPIHWQAAAQQGTLLVGIMGLALWWVPVVRPAAINSTVQAGAAQSPAGADLLAQSIRETTERLRTLQQISKPDPAHAGNEQALGSLKRTLDDLWGKTIAENRERLAIQQALLESLWRQGNQQRLKLQMSETAEAVVIGKIPDPQMKIWDEELQAGKLTTLEQYLRALHEQLQVFENSADTKAQASAREQVQARLSVLQEFARQRTQSQPLQASVQRLLYQVQAAPQTGDPLQFSLAEAFSVVHLEFEQLARQTHQSTRVSLALQTVELALAINERGVFTGAKPAPTETLAEDYTFYSTALARMQIDHNTHTVSESDPRQRARDAAQFLMQLKSNSARAKARTSISSQEAVRTLQAGISEVMFVEQIPLYYQPTVRQYFQQLAKVVTKANAP